MRLALLATLTGGDLDVIAAREVEEIPGDACAARRIAGDGGNGAEVEARVADHQREGERVVDVGADVGVEEDGKRGHGWECIRHLVSRGGSRIRALRERSSMGFLELLESFNRKERFFLVGYALGKPAFTLDERFAADLGKVTGFRIPTTAIVFMDYHLDWIHAAAFLSDPAFVQADCYDNANKTNTGNQEDIDLVIGFQDGGTTRLVLIEAKGDISWGNRQLQSKADRLNKVFGDDGANVSSVIPTFVLTSPNGSKGILLSGWPEWMRRGGKPLWMELPWPKNRRRVIGCDDRGNPFAKRPFFKIEMRK